MKIYNYTIILSLFLFLTIWSVNLQAQCSATEVGGTVFREYKFDGSQNPAVIDMQTIPGTRNGLIGSVETRPEEMPYNGGMIVNIYDSNGLLGSTMTDLNGSWTFDISSASSVMVRIEYIVPTGFESGPNGSENTTSVLFSEGGNCNNDFTIANRCDHCQDDPGIAALCFCQEYG